MRAPAQLGRLHALGDKAFHRPGVDEDVHRLRSLGALSVALGDVDALDAELLRELAPGLAALRLGKRGAGVACDVEQSLLDEPGDHARVCAAGGDSRGAPRAVAAGLQQRLAQRVVRTLLRADILVEIKAGPRLDHGVHIERADLATQLHDVDGGRVDRQVDAKALTAAGGQKRRQELAIIVAGDRLLDEAHPMSFCELAVLMRIDDDEARLVIIEMPLDQGQGAFADRAEADHDNGAGDLGVDLRGGAHG